MYRLDPKDIILLDGVQESVAHAGGSFRVKISQPEIVSLCFLKITF